jgi:hypothetical protein
MELASKPWLRFYGKAQGDEKAQHTIMYVSILKRTATPPANLRRGFGDNSQKRLA